MNPMQELIGTQYKDGGASPADGFDCFGFVRWVIRKGLGVSLPENAIGWRRYGEIIDGWPQPVERYDLIFFSSHIPGIVTHVGVADDEKDFTHASAYHGAVVCEPISKYAENIRAIGKIRRDTRV